MVDNPIDWINKKIDRVTEGAGEWFKQATGFRDVMPKGPKPRGGGRVQSAPEAGEQLEKGKNPYSGK